MLLFMWATNRASADGLIYQLPPDGAWVTYTLSQAGTNRVSFPPGLAQERQEIRGLLAQTTGFLTLRSVGTVVIDGEACRWIELKTEVDMRGEMPDAATGVVHNQQSSRRIILKILIPEHCLSAGSDPLAHVRRMYFQDGSEEPEAIDDDKDKQYQIDRFRPFFPAPPLEPRTLSRDSVNTATLGSLDCEKHSFHSSYEGPLARGRRGWWTWRGMHEVWVNDKVPFGVVSLRFVGRSEERSGEPGRSALAASELTNHLVVSAVGTGAQSELHEGSAKKARGHGNSKPATVASGIPGSVLTRLLRQDQIQHRLRLSEDQVRQVETIDRALAAQRGPTGSMRALERSIQSADEAARRQIDGVLSKEQMKGMFQIALEEGGPVYGLNNKWVADTIELTSAQRKEAAQIQEALGGLLDDAVKGLQKATADRRANMADLERTIAELRKDANNKAARLLTPKQREAYERLRTHSKQNSE